MYGLPHKVPLLICCLRLRPHRTPKRRHAADGTDVMQNESHAESQLGGLAAEPA